MPMAIFIDAEAKHEHKKADGDVHFCEFGQKQVFRRLDLPSPISVDKVTATLDQGILRLIAPKAADKVKSIVTA